jgi:hypothetical protein
MNQQQDRTIAAKAFKEQGSAEHPSTVKLVAVFELGVCW